MSERSLVTEQESRLVEMQRRFCYELSQPNSGLPFLFNHAGVKAWVWKAIDELLEPYTDRKRRSTSKGFYDMTGEEVAQWEKVLAELREKLKARGKQNKRSTSKGFYDMTGKEIAQWEKVLAELREKLKARGKQNKRSTSKGFYDMTGEEIAQWEKVLAELREKLKARGKQTKRSTSKGFYDMTGEEIAQWEKVLAELREKLKARGKQTKRSTSKGFNDMTGEEIAKWEKVLAELKEKLKARGKTQKRDLKGFRDMSDDERQRWGKVLFELRQKLREKFGVQDPEEDYRVDPEVRERFKQVKKELLKVMEKKNGPVNGYEDLTDADWKAKWAKVVEELKEKFRHKNQKRYIDFNISFNDIKDFFKHEYNKLTNVLKQFFGREDVRNAIQYANDKIDEAIDAAKQYKENFDYETFKADVKVQVRDAIDKVKSFGQKVDYEMIKDIIKDSVNSVILSAKKIKSDFEASQLKKDLQEGVDEAANYFRGFLSKYTDVDELERQMAVLKQTLKDKIEVALNEIRAHESDLKQVRDSVIQRVTEGLNTVKDQVKDIDLEKVRELVKQKVNDVIEKSKDIAAKITSKRDLKSYQQMTPEERAKWDSVLAELRDVLHKKFGSQDLDEKYRLSPETRAKLAAVRKELLSKHGQTGHEDLTDDEWKKKWGEVVKELKRKFGNRERRELKGYNDMTVEERKQHEALLKELRQKLLEKFGKQDENEGLRPSMETRQKLKNVLKSIRKDQGYEDLTDSEWRQKYQKVIDELKSKFQGA